MYITYIDIYHIYAHIIKLTVVPERCCRSDSRGSRRCRYVYFIHIFNISYICVYILHMHVLSHTEVAERCCRSDSSGSRRCKYVYFIYTYIFHTYMYISYISYCHTRQLPGAAAEATAEEDCSAAAISHSFPAQSACTMVAAGECICVGICMYMYTCICIYTCTCIDVYIYI